MRLHVEQVAGEMLGRQVDRSRERRLPLSPARPRAEGRRSDRCSDSRSRRRARATAPRPTRRAHRGGVRGQPSSESSNDWTPRLSRFAPPRRAASRTPGSADSGLASRVHSTPGAIGSASRSPPKSRSRQPTAQKGRRPAPDEDAVDGSPAPEGSPQARLREDRLHETLPHPGVRDFRVEVAVAAPPRAEGNVDVGAGGHRS